MHVAFIAPDRFRVDLETQEPPIESGERSIVVGDGSSVWLYESRSDTYTRTTADDPAGFLTLQYYLTPGAFFGGGGIATLIEGIRSQTDTQAVIASEDTLLGRPVYVLEISPAYRGSKPGPDGREEEYSGGVVRMWLDKQYLFALRTQVPDGEDGVVEIHFTQIEFNTSLDDALFDFSPPPGARQIESAGDGGFSSSGGTIGGSDVGMPSPFFSPAELPGGYSGRSSGTSSDSNGAYFSARFLLLEDSGDGYVRGEQRIRTDGMPASLRTGERASVTGHEAWLTRSPDALSLAWQDGDIVIVLTTNSLSKEELLRLAASMRIRAGMKDTPAAEEEPPPDEQPGSESEAVPAQPSEP